MIDIGTASASDFEPCLNQVFATEVGEFHLNLVLKSCELSQFGPHDEDTQRRHPFSLTFAAEGQPQLSQGTYVLQNETLGELAIFLVPVGTGKYEATFH